MPAKTGFTGQSGLNFSKVNSGVTGTAVNGVPRYNTPLDSSAALAKAVLLVHGELPRDDNGVASVTIRQLLELTNANITGLLREYVCSFGKHGISVIDRYVSMTVDTYYGAELKDEVIAKFNKDVEQRVANIKVILKNQ